MRGAQSRCLPVLLFALLIGTALPAVAQDIDTVVTATSRSPSTVADEITDPVEKSAFLSLYRKQDPSAMLTAATRFLTDFPQSAFLAQAYEVAADSSFDLNDYPAGLDYAQKSLVYLPENPELLAAVADVQARQHANDAAIESGRSAIDLLDRFGRPGAVPEREWPAMKQKLQASAHFAIGRALLQKALGESTVEQRSELFRRSEESLLDAQRLHPDDSEIVYVLGLVHLSQGRLEPAANDFARVYQGQGPFAAKSFSHLQEIYKILKPPPKSGFEVFVQQAARQNMGGTETPPAAHPEVQPGVPEYAGSDSCRECHGGVYRAWSQSGMSRMFRRYAPENVIGDFSKNNEFFAGDLAEYQDSKLRIIPDPDRAPYARMVIRNDKHYFEIFGSDGQWHSYPVDYTIGSKWQQAYATKLANGQIHVFPLQYNAIEKRWLNYWKVIDTPGTARSDLHAWQKMGPATSYQAVCAVCHTSQLRNVKGGGFEADSLEFRETGIGCEMCHGPSARHVASMKTGEEYEKTPLDPPVDFGKISSRNFVAICSQCHMQSAIRIPGPNGELNYSPSRVFFMRDASIPFGEFSRKGFYKDGRFRQTTFIVEALQRSKCFQKSQLSCGSCHDPHIRDEASNLTALKFQGDPNKMCTNCHTQFQDRSTLAVHTHHAPESEASQCVSCHMPRIMEALLFRARTHQIDDIPNPDMTLRFGQQQSPNACLLCHSGKTAQWVKDTMTAWKAAH